MQRGDSRVERSGVVAAVMGILAIVGLGTVTWPVRPSTADSPTPTAAPKAPFSFSPGWNLIPGKLGPYLPCCFGPFYTLQAGDTQYEAVQDATELMPALGYWVYLDRIVESTIYPPFLTETYMVDIPAQQWVMIGDPFIGPAYVGGADVVYVYDSTSGYHQGPAASIIDANQGALVYSRAGGNIILQVTAFPSAGASVPGVCSQPLCSR